MSGRYSAVEGPWLVVRDPQDGELARVVGEAADCETAYRAAALLEDDDSRQPQLEGYYPRDRRVSLSGGTRWSRSPPARSPGSSVPGQNTP